MLCMNTLEGVIIKCKYGLEIKTLMKLIGDGLLLKDLSTLQDEKSAYTTQELLEMIFCNSNKMMWCNNVLGLFCTSTFGVCYGDNCENSAPIIDQEEGVTRQ